MDRYALEEVADLQSIKGIPFPTGVSFRQLVITGPPGVGKTTLLDAIGGWPEEGFLDLTRPNWWRSRVLAFRPRQVHLGLPFVGHDRGLSVFEDAWLGADSPPVLDLERIRLPPLGSRRDPWRWRRKYVFEFLLPPPRKVFEARSRRSDRLSHPVDDDRLGLGRVKAQLETSWRVARHLHLAGMPTYVRDDFGAPPKVFAETASTEVVEKHLRGEGHRRGRSLLHTYVKRIISPSGYRVLDRFEQVELRGRRALVPRRILPVEIRMRDQRIELHADDGDAVRAFDPEAYVQGPAPFARLLPGDLLRLPGEQLRTALLPREGPARIEIGHEGDWLTVIDLDSPSGTSVQALHGTSATRIADDREARMARLRAILDPLPHPLEPRRARRDLNQAIGMLEASHWRPRNRDGEPGGLVELPDGILPIVVGDLHGRVDNLLTVLAEGRALDALEDGRAALVLLGDVVHPEDGDLGDMTSSLLAHDVVVRLMLAFPGRIIHLRGNHESFSAEMTKGGVAQGRLWKRRIIAERGDEMVDLMRRFYQLLPHVAAGPGFVACHAGPPTGSVSRRKLIELEPGSRMAHDLTWGRVRSPRRPGGYTKRDVRALQKALGLPKPSVMIVSHNPGPDQDAVQLEHGGIKRHHLVYSARADHVAAFGWIDDDLVPLVYPTRTDFTDRVPADAAP
ncbi:metallophosphoesterase [Gaopeijia maritima]|uniref:Metallophosphoesterase n=1 Tax=Gaopeijia maritima TaxID=3119007 RepID=A0ABU9E722_9BACT